MSQVDKMECSPKKKLSSDNYQKSFVSKERSIMFSTSKSRQKNVYKKATTTANYSS